MTETDHTQKWREWKRLGPRAAVISSCIGLAATIVWMMWEFRSLDNLAPGDPSTVSKPVGEVLIPTVIGLPAGLLGVAIFITGALKLRGVRRPPEILQGNPPH